MREHVRAAAALALVWWGAACGDASGPELPRLRVDVVAGDGQYGLVGEILPTPLHAVVTTAANGTPRKEVTVLWEVVEGDASFVTSPAAATDSTGSTFATVRLGTRAGPVRIGVSVVDQTDARADFTVFAVDAPALTGLDRDTADAGTPLTLTGSNFLPDPSANVVLFSGIRGRVDAAAPDRLVVEVPPCLPSGDVDVTVMIGGAGTAALPLTIGSGGAPASLSPGSVLDVADPAAPSCLRLSGAEGAAYLVVAQSTASAAVARHEVSFVGLVETGGAVTAASRSGPGGRYAVPSRSGAVTGPGRRVGEGPEGVAAGERPRTGEAGVLWERRLRLLEARALRSRDRTGRGLAPERGAEAEEAAAVGGAGPERAVPSVGHERTFHVLTASGSFDDVTAVARYVGRQAVLYVDKAAPTGGFDTADLQAFSDEFDDRIHPAVSGAFGQASDLDGNDRIVILFTPAVNRLTPRGSDGFVGGFFYGLDLLDDREGSNGGEVFYTLVPDEEGTFSDPHPTSQVLDVVPAILAHEYQHMIHFNQRILLREAEGSEALWLSEGLAQMAEELVARSYESSGDWAKAASFRDGNLVRARRYLDDTGDVSLVVTTGQGSLAERGAGWLHVLYLAEQFGDGVLGRLTATTRTGRDNVVHQTGREWTALLADWWAATYLDGRSGAYPAELSYGDYRLRGKVARSNGADALIPPTVGSQHWGDDFALWSASARYYILRPPTGGSAVLRFGGGGGASEPTGAGLRLRIVRMF